MSIIDVTAGNIDTEHICCAISDKKGENCAASKKEWMKERFADGLAFKKLDARGKVFIEYIPAENAWCPIEADNCMHINCFWVSGQFKGLGYANELLEECTADAKEKGKKGLTVLSSLKKMPFLSDPGYLKHKGFLTADTAAPYFELLYFPLVSGVQVPCFKECAKLGSIPEKGTVLYYSNQCPHTEKYASIFAEIAKQRGASVKLLKLENKEQAKNAPSPFTTYSLFHNGSFLTNEILSEKKINRFLDESGF